MAILNQKWQYKVQSFKPTSDENEEEFLNRHGSDAWELTCCYEVTGGDCNTYIFKRLSGEYIQIA